MAGDAVAGVQQTAEKALGVLGGENAMMNFKTALCAAILLVVLSMLLPNVLPKNDDPDNFVNSLQTVMNAHKDNLLAGVVVLVLVVLVGGLVASKF